MKELLKKLRGIDTGMLCIPALMLLGYIFIHMLFGGTLLSYNCWDSYSLQAMSWLSGRLDMGKNYEWLELAVYNGKYYLSFPPLPSVVMLPFVLLFGEKTPSNLVSALYGIFTAMIAYKILKKAGMKRGGAVFFAIAYVWGSNMLWLSTSGGVWFLAQGLNMLLLTACVYFAQQKMRVAAYAMAALAVGCRPFSVCMFLPLMAYFYMADKDRPMADRIRGQIRSLIIPAFIALCYMLYNYVRFGNVLEFGHNYLPEFTESEKGQFSLSYIFPNLYNLLLRPVTLRADLTLEYPLFDGFMFYIANPMFLIWFAAVVKDVLQKKLDAVRLCIVIAILAELLLLCAHKTLGGWQFGARYTVDMLPMALMYLLLKKDEPGGISAFIMAAGMMFNLYGALAMTMLH
ncbi:MAG: hypothetical protein SPH38_02110 [Eubacteriales bacterium]|nr:hypothetical protein [Eubacteriales bacterium]